MSPSPLSPVGRVPVDNEASKSTPFLTRRRHTSTSSQLSVSRRLSSLRQEWTIFPSSELRCANPQGPLGCWFRILSTSAVDRSRHCHNCGRSRFKRWFPCFLCKYRKRQQGPEKIAHSKRWVLRQRWDAEPAEFARLGHAMEEKGGRGDGGAGRL